MTSVSEKGRGKSIFIEDNGDISGEVISLLNSSLSPYLSNISLQFDEDIIDSIYPNPKNMEFIIKDQPLDLYIFFKENI